MENLARLLDPSWLVSRGTSARSESSHSATDKRNTRCIPQWIQSESTEPCTHTHKVSESVTKQVPDEIYSFIWFIYCSCVC